MSVIELLSSFLGVIIVPLSLFFAFYLYYCKDYGYWKKRGVPEVPPVFFLGSIEWNFKELQGVLEERWYKKYGKVFGVYEGSKPALMVADPELLKNILVKDFGSFTDLRSVKFGNPILDSMLIAQNGQHWKDLRTAMSPAFTSGKLKVMSHLIKECAEKMIESYIENSDKEVDVRRYFGAFTIDVIAKCAFGLKLDSRKDPDNPFVKHARAVLETSPWRFIMLFLAPKLSRLIRLSAMDPKTVRFFEDVIRQIIESRKNESKENKRQDFIQLLLNANEEDENIKKIGINDVIGNCMLFIIGGYFSTMSTLSTTVHALAYHPKCQERLFEEIEETAKNNKEFDFDTIAGMKYLDAVLSEVLRIQSPSPRTERTATEDYVLGDTGIIIPKGMLVAVPIYAMHHDPQYFPNPEEFNPDRFLPGNRELIKPYTYIPFGTGPRNCLGMRFALMEIKRCIVETLLRVKFSPGPSSTINIKYQTTRGLHVPEYIFLKVERRQSTKAT